MKHFIFFLMLIATGCLAQTDVAGQVELKASKALWESTLDNWCFQYKYDGRNRVTHRKTPGADWVYLVYDDRDRVAMTQDGNQRKINQWTWMKYDSLNRSVVTGLYNHKRSLAQEEMSALPVAGRNGTFEPLIVTYYDNYDFLDGDQYFSYKPDRIAGQSPSEFRLVRGKVTGVWTKVLGNDKQWIRSVNYYDDRYRLIQTVSDNHKRGLNIATSVYDFVGKLTDAKTESIDHHVNWANAHASAWILEDKVICKAGSSVYPFAFSAQQIPANTDGWVEFTCSPDTTQVSTRWFGFSAGTPTEIDFAVKQSITTRPANMTVQAVEAGISRGPALVVGAGDVIRIERKEDSIYYRKNGKTFYKHKLPSRPAWYAHARLNQPNAELFNPKMSLDGERHLTRRQFSYDHAGRLLKTRHSIDGGPYVVVSKNEYNEAGQLVDKKLHSPDEVNYRQSIDYRYNIRGWLTSMNGAELRSDNNKNKDTSTEGKDLFGIDLMYEAVNNAVGNTPLYNGNISAMCWSNNLGLGDTKEFAYNLDYDPMDRLTAAASKWYDTQWHSASAFHESGVTYDLNGNIRSLNRTDEKGVMIDRLTYNYGPDDARGNVLRRVADAGTSKGFADASGTGDDYTYDRNGNLTSDKNRNIMSISYNHLNLPEKVTKSTGDYLLYTYDATGSKLAQDVYDKTNVLKKRSDYRGEWFYENDTLRFVNHEEGRVVAEGDWIPAPQLLPDPEMTRAANFGPSGTSNVTITGVMQDNESYLKVVSNQSNGTPGFLSPFVKVVPGRKYTLRMKGYSANNSQVVLYVLGNGYSSGDILWPGPVLPKDRAEEDWVDVTFAVPVTMNRIRVGATWRSGAAAGNGFYVNSMELYEYNGVHGNTVFATSGYTYQYHLKDHLGNVRMTFTTKEDKDQVTATMENDNAERDRSNFARYDLAKRVRSELLDHTNDGKANGTGYSVRLNGSVNEKIGLARSFSVMPGDTIRAEVFAKYIDPENRNWTGAMTMLTSYVALPGSAPPGTVVDGRGYTISGSTSLGVSLVAPADAETGFPRAYLNFLFVDRNYDLNSMRFAYDRIAGGKENGSDVPHDRLTINELITEPGYVYVYLTNEREGNEVYFDDLTVEHIHSPVIQSQDYYPFGLTFNSYSRENASPDQYQYNGKEVQDELSLAWLDYGARMYMPELGRWNMIDPKSGKYSSFSPYNYVLDNPVNAFDPDGRDAILIVFPDYKIQTPAGKVGGLGHAGVLIIDNKTGLTRYYEYGRYGPNGTGEVKNRMVSNVKIDKKTGKPTVDSLNKVLGQISELAGHNGRIRGAYVVSDKFEKMRSYAEKKMDENENPKQQYSLTSNNCGTFARDVVKQDEEVDNPTIFNPTPINIIDEYIEEGNAEVNYDAKNRKTTIVHGDETDAKKHRPKKTK